MDKAWVENKNRERDTKLSELYGDVRNILVQSNIFTIDEVTEILNRIKEMLKKGFTSSAFMLPHELYDRRKELYGEDKDSFFDFYDKAHDVFEGINFDEMYRIECESYEHYQDSEPVEFDGDIIITDPCYIMKEQNEEDRPQWKDYMRRDSYEGLSKDELKACGFFDDYDALRKAQESWDDTHPDDWEICEFGQCMDELGINHFMTRGTIYGDWSCTTYNTDTREEIGSFCADAGLVSVILLDDVLKYNPSYDDHINKKWTTTWIKDFKGTVQFVVKEVRWTLDRDIGCHKNGDEYVDYQVEVVGHGVNKKTNKPINFVGTQTGL